jgi:hypothetical protein
MMAEIEKRVRECMAQIQHYRSYVGSARSNEIVNELMKVESLAGNQDKESIETALKIATELHQELATSMYSGYVQTTLDNLKSIMEHLEEAREQFMWAR